MSFGQSTPFRSCECDSSLRRSGSAVSISHSIVIGTDDLRDPDSGVFTVDGE
jgi:hypothetical protein